MNHIQNILKIGGSLGSFALASSIDPSGGFICNAIEAISGNLASNFVARYDPAALLEFLKKPSELNHDIEKLMIDSVEKAVKLVTVKYLDENPYEDKFVKNTLDQLIKDAKTYSENVDSTIIDTDEDAWVKNINEYIFRGQPDEDGKLTEIADFFKANLKISYELVFNEGLKDDKNEKPLKAFLIKSLTGLSEQADKNSEIQQKILAEIQKLKENKPAESLTIAKGYFEAEFKKLNRKLDKVLEIAVKSDGNIELILQILKAFVNNQPTKLPQHLTLPPLVPEVFEGRTDELQNIKKALFEDENLLLLVNGEGGIGKTSLAAKYYQQYAHAYKHLAWVLCEQSIADALLTLALPLKLQFEDNATTDQRLKILLKQMVNLGNHCLLIIDNANEVADLDKNYRLLRQCPNFHILLTSRINEFNKAKFLKIDSLPPEQALVVFREHYPKLQATEEPIFGGIYTAVGGNTLVLELLAKNVALQNTFKTKYSLPDLLADLQTKGLLQIVEDDAVNVEYQSYQTAKPTEVIAAMYDLSKLSEAESRLLSIFAVLPAENIAYDTLEILLPQTLNFGNTLKSLAQKGWLIHNTTDNTLKCSPVIQEITQAKNQNLYADCEELISVLIDKFGYTDWDYKLFGSDYETQITLIRLSESIIGNFNKPTESLDKLSKILGNYYETNYDFQKAETLYEKFIISSYKQNLKSNSYLLKLIRVYRLKNDIPKAFEYLKLLQSSLEEEKIIYFDNYSFDFEDCNFEYGKLYFLTGDFKNALKYALEAYSINSAALEYHYSKFELDIWDDYTDSLEQSRIKISGLLGDIYFEIKQYDKSLEYFFEMRNLCNCHINDTKSLKLTLLDSFRNLSANFQKLKNKSKTYFYLKSYYLEIKKLNEKYPKRVILTYYFVLSYCDWGLFYKQNMKLNEAKYNFQQAYELMEWICQQTTNIQYQNQFNWVKNALAGLGG